MSKNQKIKRTIFSIIISLFFGFLTSCFSSQEKIKPETLEIITEKESAVLNEQNETNNEIYDCEKLPSLFSSYESALDKIHNANYRYSEEISIINSSWLKGASYFSCDGSLGFFIIKTDKQYYIHQNLHINIWNEFKNSSSYGRYYQKYIKNNYKMIVN